MVKRLAMFLNSYTILYITLKPCPHCLRKVRLSQKSATVAENGETAAKFGDSLTFVRLL